MQTIIDQYSDILVSATKHKKSLCISGGRSKDFYGNSNLQQNNTVTLNVAAYNGIIDYEPTELVVTARAGTSLIALEAALNQQGQMLAFEPPHFAATATLGGCVAAGLSGPRRSSAGALRDFVLGVRILSGSGEDLFFGGQVMKNVAGYDVSRLMVGSMGTLGVILEVSLKVLPLPPVELTLRLPLNEVTAIEKMNQWAGKSLAISATCFCKGELFIRLSGAASAVRATQTKLGGEVLVEDKAFWESVREQTHNFFQSAQSIWRLSIKSTTPPLSLPGHQLIEWNGALRWLVTDSSADTETIRATAKKAGGHATLFRSQQTRNNVFHPLDPGMMKIHQLLKQKFDPAGILNPGRLYPDL